MEAPLVSIGLSDPKSPANVGAVMRAAGCFQADKVFYTGERYDRAARFHTDTKNRVLSIPLQHTDCLVESMPAAMHMVCVELVEGAIALPEFQHPPQAMYVFGPEDGSLKQELIDRADEVVYIPTIGCLNLAATVNVVLYDRLLKAGQMAGRNGGGDGDELIRASRDTNNRLRRQV